MAELLPHQRQADEFAILVAVADDGATLRRQRQHRHQLRLRACFQADRYILRSDDVLDHRFLLVDLDRVQRGVFALIFEALNVGIEGTGQMTYPVLQNVREAHQQRQGQPGIAQLLDQAGEFNGRAIGSLWAHFDMTVITDRKVACTPVANTIDATAVRCGPLTAVIFTCASYGHLGLLRIGMSLSSLARQRGYPVWTADAPGNKRTRLIESDRTFNRPISWP